MLAQRAALQLSRQLCSPRPSLSSLALTSRTMALDTSAAGPFNWVAGAR